MDQLNAALTPTRKQEIDSLLSRYHVTSRWQEVRINNQHFGYLLQVRKHP
ncbi:MAG: hypothetical protein ACRC6S_09890 [Shewanella sp.]